MSRIVVILVSVIFLAGLSSARADDPVTGALGEMTLGADDAPITLIEYASVTCNHCADFHLNDMPGLKADYIETGKVRLILREFPLIPGHPALIARSYAGSMLARCAADDGGVDQYFAVMADLFEQQESWAFGEDARGELLKIASDAGLNESDFDACIQRADLKSHIDANMQIAMDDYDLQATPGFVIIVDGEETPVRANELAEALKKAVAEAS